MGFIDSNVIIAEAIMTRRGRELIMSNNQDFVVTKFAISDDDMNYGSLPDQIFLNDNIATSPVLEPSFQEVNEMEFKVLRTVTNYGDYISENVAPNQIPASEYSLVYTKQGSGTFSLENYTLESQRFSFAISISGTTLLSNSFIIDMSRFWNYNNIYFDVTAESPVGFVTAQSITSNYWYVVDTTHYVINNSVKPVILGLSSLYKQSGTPDLSQFTNSINGQTITFSLQLSQDAALRAYSYMLQNQLNSITDKITIYNNDSTIAPKTNFYGVNSSYQSIGTTITITITL